jgi:glycosyltransferase involved in cell wall biosynthesis
MPGPRHPIRVLRLITRLNVGGPAIQAITLSDRLTARGFETRLVHGSLSDGEGDMRYLLPPGVDAVDVPSLQRSVAPVRDAEALLTVDRLLRRTRPAIVHTHTAKAGTIGRIAAAIYNRTTGRRCPARVVHTYHGHVLDGYFAPRTARLFTFAERRLAHMTDAIVAISPRIRSELLEDHRIGRADQYRVIPLGFDLRELIAIDAEARRTARMALDIPELAHVVTSVGRLTAVKQHRLFLEAAQRIAKEAPAALFLIAGDGELRAPLEALARELGIGDRTRFLGWRRDLAIIYAATDVFLLTSRNEGTPVALIESLASGVPGVSTDVGGVRDVIDSPDVGLLAPFGDASALAEAVGRLLSDEATRRAMGARGRKSMIARYGIDRLIDDVEAL